MVQIKAPVLYRLKCNTCNSFIIKEGLIPKYTCNVSDGHIIDQNYFAVLEDENLQKTLEKDYKKHRKELIEYLTVSGASMSQQDLMYATAHFCTPKSIRDQFFTIEEQIELGRDFNRRSIESRRLRWDSASVELFNRLDLQEAFAIGQTLELPAFRYLNYGIEGTTVGDPPGIFDYFMGTSGTPYEVNNFMSTNYVPIGMTLEELQNKILDIVVSGNYKT